MVAAGRGLAWRARVAISISGDRVRRSAAALPRSGQGSCRWVPTPPCGTAPRHADGRKAGRRDARAVLALERHGVPAGVAHHDGQRARPSSVASTMVVAWARVMAVTTTSWVRSGAGLAHKPAPSRVVSDPVHIVVPPHGLVVPELIVPGHFPARSPHAHEVPHRSAPVARRQAAGRRVEGLYSATRGDYRVVCEVGGDRKVVTVHRVQHRRTAYRRR
jgi:mRNA interferase RelE/StbE